MEDVKHLNKVDKNEQVYCHNVGKVVIFDGPFVAKTCWLCPLWGGLSDGYGVVCIWDDVNAAGPNVTYTKPGTAMTEAGERPSDLSAIGSEASLAALQARTALASNGDSTEGEAPADEEPASDEEMQNVMSNVGEEAPAEAAPAKKTPPAKKAPPSQAAPASKKGKVPPQFAK